MNFSKVFQYMEMALQEAREAFGEDEVPVGAVIVSPAGEILSQAFNTKEKECCAINHAEILAIEKASKKIKAWRLSDCSLFVTLEPCPMCMSAISQARIKNVYFGAYDPKGGAISLGYSLHNDKRLNHKVNIFGGFKHTECSRLISQFFKQKRRRYNP